MKIHWLLLAAAIPCLVVSANGQEKVADSIGNLDPEMAAVRTVEDGVAWYDIAKQNIEGRILPEQDRERWFDRFPKSADGSVTSNVWNLSRHSAGMMVRFKTDATAIHIHYKLMRGALAMPHMPATGVSGVDLYARDGNGDWRWVQVTRPTSQVVKTLLVDGLAPGTREYAAYLPLYNGVEYLKFGVSPENSFEQLTSREKPIVFYGTSITHGACASRPGMVHTGILGRRFDQPVVNLGFSGNGKMDPEVGNYLIQIDAAVYVIDCLPNMNAAMVADRCIPLVKQIRAAKPHTPIVLVEDRRNTNSWILPARDAHHTANHEALQAAYKSLLADGVTGLHYIAGDELYGTDGDGATDGSHASDLGFMRQADVFEPVLRKAMNVE
ncbi:MAG: SGNH/GDSL hydrolase family protein [Rhodopirellula sp. JB055]|uniref:SGNH/GDSL hydrolase family protein n=1 Tax=Rhodopirellula sp. JB055 TaxID=3342846 RepID=UPI00370CAC64